MKITFFVFVTTFASLFALSQANAETATPTTGQKTYLVQVNGTTVAILPFNPERTISVCCSGNASYDKGTGVVDYTKEVRLVASIPNQADITITGDHLTLQPQR